MDVIAKCGFGLKVNSLQNKDDPFVKHAKKAFDFSLFNPMFMLVSKFINISKYVIIIMEQ